ncbi:MAG: hypothetical protein ABJ004_13675 [Cyclobacteriaceae bacterium]
MKKLLIISLFFIQYSISFSQVQEVKSDYMWGKMENGEKVGIWQYYDEPGELSLMINYTTGKLRYIKRDTSKYLVKEGDAWIEANVNTPPHFIGSEREVIEYISENIGFPVEARMRGLEGITIISATIDDTGNFGDFEVIKKLEGGYTDEVLNALSALPNTWIQATNSSGGVPSKLIFAVIFGVGKEYKIKKRDKKKYSILEQDKPYIIHLAVTALGKVRPH